MVTTHRSGVAINFVYLGIGAMIAASVSVRDRLLARHQRASIPAFLPEHSCRSVGGLSAGHCLPLAARCTQMQQIRICNITLRDKVGCSCRRATSSPPWESFLRIFATSVARRPLTLTISRSRSPSCAATHPERSPGQPAAAHSGGLSPGPAAVRRFLVRR